VKLDRLMTAIAANSLIAAALLQAAAPSLAAEASATEPLGRLFFTPERRAALERQRLLNIQESQAQLVEGANLTVNGVVQSSSGKRTTWINGTAQNDNSTATGVRVDVDKHNPGRTTITAGEEAPASLKVGEAINRTTREKSSGTDKAIIQVPGATRHDTPAR